MFLALLLQAAAPAPPVPPAPPRVLVYTVSAGYEHAVVKRPATGEPSLVERSLAAWGKQSGAFEAVVTRDPAAFEKGNLARFGAVCFYTTGELPLSDAQRGALFEFVRGGGGFVGLHCATDTFYGVPEYGEMIGAYFDGHPWHQKVRVVVEDRAHAATAMLGESFEFFDEIYQFKAPWARADVHVLLSLAPDFVAAAGNDAVRRKDGDFALAWTRPFGAGRVFYSALGHGEEAWSDPRFEAHVVGGLRFALRTEPRTKMSEANAARRAHALAAGGDPRAGRAVFQRDSAPMCVRCHVVMGAGTAVGPDLSSVARRLTPEEIVDSILAPSATITHGYDASSFELANGTLAFGRIVSEKPDALTIVEPAGTPRTLQRADVKSWRRSTVSVMPDGLADTLTDDELRDLVAYVRTLKSPPAVK
jgi:putative heme-binding domain-containing protein